MKSAKKNISSLWKAMKERLSGTLTKRQNGKGRNLQSTVMEKKSLFSKPAKETKDPEEEIFEELEKITFHFGDKEPTVGEANLAFVHEIKMELRRVYVIALSENYGTILFYLPEKLTEKIAGRVAQLSICFEDYLYNLIEWRPKTLELSYALAKCSYTAEEVANSLMLLSAAMKEKPLAPTSVRIRSNNWLKLHGYPMRRRKGRRHYE